jgi:hypothetical protein
MRESTASAPGGHYDHYKTAAVIAKLDEKHQDYFPHLAETYAAMTSLPLKHGFAPKRWCNLHRYDFGENAWTANH